MKKIAQRSSKILSIRIKFKVYKRYLMELKVKLYFLLFNKKSKTRFKWTRCRFNPIPYHKKK